MNDMAILLLGFGADVLLEFLLPILASLPKQRVNKTYYESATVNLLGWIKHILQ